MKAYFKKTTTKTQQHLKIRNDLILFYTKYIGKTIKHLRKIRKDTAINDATLISFASGKVNVIQETKVFVVSKHNDMMPTNNTNTYALRLGINPILIKATRHNPLFRNHLPERANKNQKRNYSTNNVPNPKDPKPKGNGTWTEWYNENVYPFFTEDYYYVGYGVVLIAAVGAGLGGYHAYQWWNSSSTNNYTPPSPPMNSNTTSDALTQNAPLDSAVASATKSSATNNTSNYFTNSESLTQNAQLDTSSVASATTTYADKRNTLLNNACDKLIDIKNTLSMDTKDTYTMTVEKITNRIQTEITADEYTTIHGQLKLHKEILESAYNVSTVTKTVTDHSINSAMLDGLLSSRVHYLIDIIHNVLHKSSTKPETKEDIIKDIDTMWSLLIDLTNQTNDVERIKMYETLIDSLIAAYL